MPRTNGDGSAILLFASPKDKGILPPKLKDKAALPGMSDMPEDEMDGCDCECCSEGCDSCKMEGKCCAECEYEDSGSGEEEAKAYGPKQEKMSAMREMVIKISQGE